MKTNNPKGINQYTKAAGAKVGGALESLKFQGYAANLGAKTGKELGSMLADLSNKEGVDRTLVQAEYAFKGAMAGRKVGAEAARISDQGEIKGAKFVTNLQAKTKAKIQNIRQIGQSKMMPVINRIKM